jgi:hypothetical protein
MIERWLRRALRSCGLDLPFSQVICPEDVKTIAFGRDAGAKVTVQRTLVFLEAPEAGDLHDTILEPGSDRTVYASPDALEIGRKQRGRTTRVSWRPRAAVTPYALYSHEFSWDATGAYGDPAVYAEVTCELRTGVLVLEMLTPGMFETAIVFKRPRWPRLTSDRSIIKYAISQLDQKNERPVIADYGKRLQWRIMAPQVGDNYICVAFHQYGVAQAQDRLKETSLMGRLRALIRPLIPA